MSEMSITTSISMHDMTLDKLQSKLKQASTMIDGSATIRISVIQGDRPWESDQYSLEIRGKTKD